jgi:NAD(P)H-hydrate epimerase
MPKTDLPAVTAEQMRQIDELAVGPYHINLLQMMENAGRSLARLARDGFLGGNASGRRVLVLAGHGGNGGGGMAGARRLHGWGAQVSVLLAANIDQLADAPRQQWQALKHAGVTLLASGAEHSEPELIIDAMLGYSSRGAPRSPIDRHIRLANGSGTPILALDLPTGLGPDDGHPHDPTIKASATLTLALPKTGLLAAAAAEHIGQLWLADLGLPPRLFAELGLSVPPDLFAADDLVKLGG